MIDAQLDESDPVDEEDQENISEIRFVPENRAELDAMFKAMVQCQALHPDPNDSLSEDDDGCYEDAEDDGAEYDVSAAESGFGEMVDAENGVSVFNQRTDADEPMDVGQFDDAEPEH